MLQHTGAQATAAVPNISLAENRHEKLNHDDSHRWKQQQEEEPFADTSPVQVRNISQVLFLVQSNCKTQPQEVAVSSMLELEQAKEVAASTMPHPENWKKPSQVVPTSMIPQYERCKMQLEEVAASWVQDCSAQLQQVVDGKPSCQLGCPQSRLWSIALRLCWSA